MQNYIKPEIETINLYGAAILASESGGQIGEGDAKQQQFSFDDEEENFDDNGDIPLWDHEAVLKSAYK